MLKHALPTGTKLFIVDDLSPEDLAMLQALYSRSAESVEAHLEKVAKAGSGKFMSRFYVGYNHKSIADCGTTTMFIEGVSTLAAKAIQDWPLYSGQETSTRYIDMSNQRIEDPLGTDRSKEVLQRWMAFYTGSQDRVAETIRKRYPRRPDEKEDDYERAVKARTFDSLRGFLPAGITTQLSWHTNLRQAGDHLTLLARHPAKEIRDIGLGLQKMFAEQYTSSGGFDQAAVSAVTGGAEARAVWDRMVAETYTYTAHMGFPNRKEGFHSNIHAGEYAPYRDLLQSRPRGSVLPHFLTDLGQCSFAFLLDFGSFRDLQRHRNGVVRMPLLTIEHGFERWYIDQLDEEYQEKARELIAFLSGAITHMTNDPIARQYYTPLGFLVPCQVTWGLPAAIYVLELRSSKTVHPTLRRRTHSLIELFRRHFPDIPLHVDLDPDDWTVRRGQQTILERQNP